MHISLTSQLEEYTREKVSSGLYNNASEVIRESLRLMVKRDQTYEALKNSITRGFGQIEQGDCTDITNTDDFLAMARSRRSK